MSDPTYGSPTRASLERGELADDPNIPIDVRAARAWHRAMVQRGTARNDTARSLRMSVRHAVEQGDLTEAEHRLAALNAYADAPVVVEVDRGPIPEMDASWKVVRNLADAMYTCVDDAVELLSEEYDLDGDEETQSRLADRLFNLAHGLAE